MTLPAARDLAPVGVRVMTIAPGIIDTPMLGALPEASARRSRRTSCSPSGSARPTSTPRSSRAIVENGYLNGETIRLDGALRMPPK